MAHLYFRDRLDKLRTRVYKRKPTPTTNTMDTAFTHELTNRISCLNQNTQDRDKTVAKTIVESSFNSSMDTDVISTTNHTDRMCSSDTTIDDLADYRVYSDASGVQGSNISVDRPLTIPQQGASLTYQWFLEAENYTNHKNNTHPCKNPASTETTQQNPPAQCADHHLPNFQRPDTPRTLCATHPPPPERCQSRRWSTCTCS
jgi:hypothetical protein